MRVESLEFHGYGSGETDFGTLHDTYDPEDVSRSRLDAAISKIAGILEAGDGGSEYVAIAVVGFSDRDDAPGDDCDTRRATESSASLNRAFSAWNWLQSAVNAQLVTPIDNWPDTSNHVTWINVPVGASVLVHDPPTDETQRAENRVVKFVFSFFPADAP